MSGNIVCMREVRYDSRIFGGKSKEKNLRGRHKLRCADTMNTDL
jgi:hypothetical protein